MLLCIKKHDLGSNEGNSVKQVTEVQLFMSHVTLYSQRSLQQEVFCENQQTVKAEENLTLLLKK